MAIYDTHSTKSRGRVDASGLFALVMIIALFATLALDAYAFTTVKL